MTSVPGWGSWSLDPLAIFALLASKVQLLARLSPHSNIDSVTIRTASHSNPQTFSKDGPFDLREFLVKKFDIN